MNKSFEMIRTLPYWLFVMLMATALLNGCTSIPPTADDYTQQSYSTDQTTQPTIYQPYSTSDSMDYLSGSSSSSQSKRSKKSGKSKSKKSKTNTLRAASASPAQPSGGGKYHTVQPGENVYRIAKRYGRSVQQLAAWNGLDSSYNVSVGQQLVVSGAGGSSRTLSKSSYTSADYIEGQCHVVKAGTTLYSIARSYGHSVAEVARWNGIRPPYNLKPGSRIAVSPGASCR